ncbi:MAG: acyloxyacyl hydrolase [Alphaproteobacteria bacterium]
MHQHFITPTLILIFCLSVVKTNAHAKDFGFLGLSVGYYNALDSNNNSATVAVEYRPSKSVVFKRIKPWFGLQVNSRQSIWGGGGLLLELEPTKNTFLTTSFGVGLYSHGNNDIDLNHPIQFKSQIELGYKFKNKNRVSIALNHISHAGLGGNKNPGSESLLLYFHTPINSIF